MQTESDLQMFFTKVDGSYPGRHKDLQPVIVWKSSKTPVATDFRLLIPVEHSGSVVDYRSPPEPIGSILTLNPDVRLIELPSTTRLAADATIHPIHPSFETLDNDISFEIMFHVAEDGKEGAEDEAGVEIMVEGQRCDSHLGPITGTIPLTRPGRLTMVWDNKFSWFKHKVLSYSVTLHVPSLIATERAKCGRAMNALRACVRERDGLHARVQETTKDVQEVDDNSQRLREEIEELQRKLDAASILSDQLWREINNSQQREELEARKIQGLTFRIMPQAVLWQTLSFSAKEDQWLYVCKDWFEVLSPALEENIAQD